MPMDPMKATDLLIKVTEAVHHLHSQPRPIVHRDLKPNNILLDEAGRPFVADFGLAVVLDDRFAARGAGTLPYMGPEQFDPRFGEIGPACDVYSLGVILYQLLTGELPFERTRESVLLTLEREPIPPSQNRKGIPAELERICLKCLRTSTRDRYRSAGDLLKNLRAFQQGEPSPDRPERARQRLVNWARREPALAVRLAVIVVCSTIMWGSRFALGSYAPLDPHHPAKTIEKTHTSVLPLSIEAILVWMNQVIFVVWGLSSWLFQQGLNRRQDQGGLQFGWRLFDVVALTLIILLDDAVMSPLTIAFPVLIVASAFWARADQIRQTTLLSMAAYILLVLIFCHFHPRADWRLWRHFHYLVGLCAIRVILTYLANRTRALMLICGVRD
jgi:serine/threonine-protein kinase